MLRLEINLRVRRLFAQSACAIPDTTQSARVRARSAQGAATA